MKVYVAGQLADLDSVHRAQHDVVAAGHRLTHDWTLGLEVGVGTVDTRTSVARADLRGVMDADAVLVVASSATPGRGLFVELGAALARAELGLLEHVVVLGPITHDTVFYFHPRVVRVGSASQWLASVGQ